jgi:hypothetical protein
MDSFRREALARQKPKDYEYHHDKGLRSQKRRL